MSVNMSVNKARGMQRLSANAKAARAAYAREWRRKNPEKQRAIVARYWEKKAAQGGEDNIGKNG